MSGWMQENVSGNSQLFSGSNDVKVRRLDWSQELPSVLCPDETALHQQVQSRISNISWRRNGRHTNLQMVHVLHGVVKTSMNASYALWVNPFWLT